MTELWNLVIVNPLINILVFVYSIVGNYGVAIIIFTLFIKLVTLPFSLQQQKSMRAQSAVQPELQALQKKYAKDKEKLAQEQMKLYKEKGINPLGGCLPVLIPWPLFIAFYQSVQTVMSSQPEQFLELSKHLLPALATHLPVGEHFLWLNLARPDPLYILPALAVVTTFVQQKMMTMASSDAQSQQMNQTMGMMMPFFMGFITLSFASGLAIYWVMFNIVGIIQQYFVTGWGELGKYIPDSILRILPGPVPVVKTTAAPAVVKRSTRPRRASADGDTAGDRPSRAGATNGETATERVPRRRRPGVDTDGANNTNQAPAPLATALPAKRPRAKKQE